MIGLIAGGLAVLGVGAAVMSFIFDELTEEEKRTQERILDNYDDYKLRKQRELNDILLRYKISEEEFYQTQNEQISEERVKFIGKYQEETEKFINNIYMKIEEQIENKKLIEIEIKDAIDRISRLNKNQKSMLRADAMIHLKRELQEARCKVIAYKHYLNQYKKNLKYVNKIDDDFVLFSFRLPEEYPYSGKLMFFPKSKLTEGEITEYIENNIKIAYTFKEDDVIEDVDENSTVPVMITEFDFNNFAHILSASKGYLKHIAINQTRIGIEAKVVEHRENRKIILDYKGLQLILSRKNLENPRRTPPCGATLRVYPINWDYSLYYDVEVSEKYQDSLKAFQFSTLPMVFSDEATKEFIDYISDNEIDNIDDEWKIGPLDENSMSDLTQIKLQLGDQLVFSANIVVEEKNYFKFDKLLSLDENFKPEDIFVVMEATLTMVNSCDTEELEEENYINMNNLGIMLFKEFRVQKALKESTEGMFYFNKWAEVTDKLINHLYKGPNVLCEVDKPNFVRFDKRTETPVFEVPIINTDEVKEYLQKVYDNYQKEFFIELKFGEYATVEFSSKADRLYVYAAMDADFSPEVLPVYCKNFCYPEIQQKLAINDFRSGRLSNSELQSYILNGENIESKKTDIYIEKFFNEKLESNDAQKDSVIKALEQENIFLIQGPPGTGKTTVIREIIRQQLRMYSFSRILIVSQANVAIDNVLKGLDSDISKRMIRCGHVDKIDDALNEVSFDQKYNNYISSILDKAEDGYNRDILIKWKAIINKGSQKYNANIGELLVKNHQIVGATCLGLMQRQIGLDRVEFDLVIIDEAGKALPSEMLIPLNRAKKIILIGDHKQLPPVINPALLDSDKIELDDKQYCEDELFSKSLFKRLYESCPETNKCMLTTQYRMPAIIGKMISDCFYEGKLKNGEPTYSQKPIYYPKNLNFLDMSNVKDFHEKSINKKSVVNEYEASVVANIVREIRNEISIDNKIAVICPYKGQKRLIIKAIRESGFNLSNDNIAVNTIDAYQGDEAEIVIYCTTRSRKPTNYFSDLARLNVAFSRVMNDLLVIGSLDYFKRYGSEHILNKIANYIIENGNIIPYDNIVDGDKNSNNPLCRNKEDLDLEDVKKEAVIDEVCATAANRRECINLEDIIISEDFLKTPPKRNKVDNFKQDYLKYGKLSNCIKINLNMVLVDGFAKYVAAKELNMKEIEVEFIN